MSTALIPTYVLTAAEATEADEVLGSPLGFDFFDFTNAANVVMALGFLIPVLTALVTKELASGRVKSLVTLGLTVLTATVATLVDADGGWALRAFGNAFLGLYLPAIAAYYGLWKPSGLTSALSHKTSNLGLGTKTPEPDVEASARPYDEVDAGMATYGYQSDGSPRREVYDDYNQRD